MDSGWRRRESRCEQSEPDRLVHALGYPLPDDIPYFFSRADGMAGGEPERETIACFWRSRRSQ